MESGERCERHTRFLHALTSRLAAAISSSGRTRVSVSDAFEIATSLDLLSLLSLDVSPILLLFRDVFLTCRPPDPRMDTETRHVHPLL
jgi:hypothetical protein